MAFRKHALSLVGLTLRNLARQPVRTSLTVLGVSLGVVAIVSFSVLVRGVWVSIEGAIKTGGADMIVFEEGIAADFLSNLDEQRVGAALRSDPNVAAAAPSLVHLMRVGEVPFVLLFGAHPDEFVVQAAKIQQGRHIRGDTELMLGATAARSLEKGVGDKIAIGTTEGEVVGIYRSEIPFFDGAIVMPMEPMQRMFGRDGEATAFLIKLEPDLDPQDAAAHLEETIDGISVITSAEEYSKVDQGLDIADGMVRVVSLLAIVVGSIIVMNTMWMTVFERTREIGVLRAVGWSQRSVMSMILIEALVVGLIAAVVGCLLGIVLAESTRLIAVGAQFNRPVYSWPTFALAFAIAVVLSLLGALAPAWRAMRISPVEALRYE